ncbi:MAG: CRISPR-associated endonuclease Cas2 [Alphaproteobacteria bacterium]|nr:CRISPR-associated endonuclease Cas2 [Alphaproteobacteria bacterium]
MSNMKHLLVMFDLPVTTKLERKAANKFRKFLKSQGYCMMQYSVYTRICDSVERKETHLRRLNAAVPPNGIVECIELTVAQYENRHMYSNPHPSAKKKVHYITNTDRVLCF